MRLRASAREESARGIAGTTRTVLVTLVLGVKLADSHGPVGAPVGTPGIMAIARELAGSHGPVGAPVRTPGITTDQARTRHQTTITIGVREAHRVEVHGGRHRPAKSTGFRGPKNDRARRGTDIITHVAAGAAHDEGQHRTSLGGKLEVTACDSRARLPQVVGGKADRSTAQRVRRDVGQPSPRSRMVRHPRARCYGGGVKGRHARRCGEQVDQVEIGRRRESPGQPTGRCAEWAVRRPRTRRGGKVNLGELDLRVKLAPGVETRDSGEQKVKKESLQDER
jgi:hypothetical protein